MQFLKLFALLLVALLVVTSAFAIGFGVNYYQTATATPSSVDVPPKFSLMWESWDIIRRDFYGKIPDAPALVHGMIRGMLQSLGDPHTVLIEPQPAKLEQNTLQGSYGGIGAQVEFKDGLFVLLPFPNGPAARAGILANDYLIKVNDTDITPSTTTQDIEVKLRGEVGSKVRLTIHRVGESERLTTVEVTLEKITLPSVQYRMLDNSQLAYVQVSLESAETAKEFAAAINALKPQNPKGLVLDLRNNPGGIFPDPVLDVAGQLLPNGGVVVFEHYRDGHEKQYDAGSGRLAAAWPLATLVNGGTASAAEVLAGALNDYGRGPLIGERTFGKGSVQQVNTLLDNSSLHITVATWLTPKKSTIEGAGLNPTIAVPLTAESKAKGVDTQLQRAIDFLQTGK